MSRITLLLFLTIVVSLIAIIDTASISENEDQSAPSSLKPSGNSSSANTTNTHTSTNTHETGSSSRSASNSSTTTEKPNEIIDDISSKNTTTFSCDGKQTGYYADVKLNCRVYHFCTMVENVDGTVYQRVSYLCLEGSFFDQKDFNCVKQTDLKIPCDQAETEFEKSNKQFDPKPESQPSYSDSLAASFMMNPLTRFIAGR